MTYKILLAIISALTVLFIVVFCSSEPPEPETTPEVSFTMEPIDWEKRLVDAVLTGDHESGRQAASMLVVNYEDMVNLSRIMAAESGPDWPEWAIMAIGEVVLNRVASPDWPDTVTEVLSQTNPVQYDPYYTESWPELKPTEETVWLAYRLLTGERVLHDKTVVYQALFPQGEQTVLTYWDEHLNTTTYFCR